METGVHTGLASPAAVAITSAVSFIGSGHSLLGRHLYLSKPSLSSTRFSSNRVWSNAIAKPLVEPYQFRAGAVPFIGGGGRAILQDAGASVMLMVGAYGLVSSFDYLTQRNLIEQRCCDLEVVSVRMI
ncbi:unnamed protein product [Ilex paraguariensis]|uniref:Uncharacterized protein n=1 Tax=Ilex paraguariensis TaxID=185542 RepID=A0ABC8SJ31_9AQUA